MKKILNRRSFITKSALVAGTFSAALTPISRATEPGTASISLNIKNFKILDLITESGMVYSLCGESAYAISKKFPILISAPTEGKERITSLLRGAGFAHSTSIADIVPITYFSLNQERCRIYWKRTESETRDGIPAYARTLNIDAAWRLFKNGAQETGSISDEIEFLSGGCFTFSEHCKAIRGKTITGLAMKPSADDQWRNFIAFDVENSQIERTPTLADLQKGLCYLAEADLGSECAEIVRSNKVSSFLKKEGFSEPDINDWLVQMDIILKNNFDVRRVSECFLTHILSKSPHSMLTSNQIAGYRSQKISSMPL